MDSRTTQTIAFLGATGSTGRATLTSLLSKDGLDLRLRIFVRSRQKLFGLFPALKDNSKCEVWEGALTNIEQMTECLHGADTIICTLGENQNIPGIAVLQVAADTIVSALQVLEARNLQAWHKPRLLLLSSSTWNERLAAKPAPVLWLIKTAFHYPYADLLRAQEIFEDKPDLLSLLLVQPPAIIDEAPTGFEISEERVRVAVSYADLGAGFAELATEDAYQKLKCVGVTSRGSGPFGKYAIEIISRITWGLVAGYVPGYWMVKEAISQL